jgi:serine/threonine-protein kinase
MPDTTAVRLPEQFGRYRIVRLLGEGGMGAVYLARDSQLDRDVALKVPQFSGADAARLLDRFRQEARAAATVHHPNICPVYDVGEIDGVHYLTMAFIHGKSLDKWVGTGKPLAPRQAAALVRKIALAMHEAHKRGVIHRDLKPANVMIDRRGEPVVMDFGLARRTQTGDQRITQTGTVMGSPAYMAPEQVKGDVHAMGPSCDVYSLGVILYELLAQRLPFTGDNLAVLAQVLLDDPPPPSRSRPDLEPALEAICLKAMAKVPAARYASMAEMAADLQAILRGSAPPVAPRAAAAPAVPPSAVRTIPPASAVKTVPPKSADGDRPTVAFSEPTPSRGPDSAARKRPRRKRRDRGVSP